MENTTQWFIRTPEQIATSLPELIGVLEPRLDEIQGDTRDRVSALIQSLKDKPVFPSQIRDGSRSWELTTLAYALDTIGQKTARTGDYSVALDLLRSAHELCRGGNPTLRPTKQMRQIISGAERIILAHEMTRAETFETDAGHIRELLLGFVRAAWGEIPVQVSLAIDESIIVEFERLRTEKENDDNFQEQFVRTNVEPILAMEFPTRLENIATRWEQIGEHLAPGAVREAKRNIKRPENLSILLPPDVWEDIQQAVEVGDEDRLRRALEAVEERLESNLKLRLDAKAEYREPLSQLRHQGAPDTFFVDARALLLRQDSRAVDKFRSINTRKSNNPTAKEWYAYALTQFGKPGDIWEVIELLEDAIKSEYYNDSWNWVARWNLACAQRKMPKLQADALDTLLPLLKTDNHTTEVFELCMLWALEHDREDVLPSLMLRSPYYEAHLLLALSDAQKPAAAVDRARFRDHYRRINRIRQQPDRVFPDPKEQLTPNRLDQLTKAFIATSMVAAGVEWFHQRLSYGEARRYFKNWECAAELNEEAKDFAAAWHCRTEQWECTKTLRNLDSSRKKFFLTAMLQWAQKHGFERDALHILSRTYRSAGMEEAEKLLWDKRLGKLAPPPPPPLNKDEGVTPVPKAVEALQAPSPEQTERTIEEFAASFSTTGSAEVLDSKAPDIERFLKAVILRYPATPSALTAAIREVVRLCSEFVSGPDEEQAAALILQLRNQSAIIKDEKARAPFPLHGLIQASERVINNSVVRAKPNVDLSILTPAQLKMSFAVPEPSQSYHTHVFAEIRLAQDATGAATNVKIKFSSPSPFLICPEDIFKVPELLPGSQTIADCIVEVKDGVEDPVDLRIHVSADIGGIPRKKQDLGRVPLSEPRQRIPGQIRYITGRPVDAERKDVFHGRDKELNDLMESFTGGRLLKLRFVNGIRRVGKSSLLYHLAGRCGPEILPIVLNVQNALNRPGMNDEALVTRFAKDAMKEIARTAEQKDIQLRAPTREDFESDGPWAVFEDFLDDIKRKTQKKNVLLCFDEMQFLVQRIADPADPMTDTFLTWLRDKAQRPSDVLIVCTGSEPYQDMKERFRTHPLWANLDSYNISFVDRKAMEKIATLPIRDDGAVWMPQALNSLWDMTEGHPWVIQHIAEMVTERLNVESRRIIGPSDVIWAAQEVAQGKENVGSLWWNEDDGQVNELHRRIAFLLLDNQPSSRAGLRESRLSEICQRAGVKHVGRYLDEMTRLEVLSVERAGEDFVWRIRGGFLESYLAAWMRRTEADKSAKKNPALANEPLALMLDLENVKITLNKMVDSMPPARAETLRSALNGPQLADCLLKAASRHGSPRQRWAIADWEREYFRTDQRAYRTAGYGTDLAGSQKSDASDHVLKEKIHWVLREVPDIEVFVIATGDGDFDETIKTLQEKGKRVVLWATQNSLNRVYMQRLKGPDPIQIEWLEDIVFGARNTVPRTQAASGVAP